jgi:hypothetical protein
MAVLKQARQQLLRAKSYKLAYRTPERVVCKSFACDLLRHTIDGNADGTNERLAHALFNDSFEQSLSRHDHTLPRAAPGPKAQAFPDMVDMVDREVETEPHRTSSTLTLSRGASLCAGGWKVAGRRYPAAAR